MDTSTARLFRGVNSVRDGLGGRGGESRFRFEPLTRGSWACAEVFGGRTFDSLLAVDSSSEVRLAKTLGRCP